MKVRNIQKPQAEQALANARISIRLDAPIAQRLDRVVEASKRTTTSILEECLEEGLPKLEKQLSRAA